MRVPITYTSSSGNVYNLQADGLRTKEANFHKWEFSALGVSQKYGINVLAFGKDPATYAMKLVLGGSVSSRKTLIEALNEEWENDIINMTPGRITWGECYLDCYIIKSDTYPDSGGWYTDMDITLYAPTPFWQAPQVIDIPAGTTYKIIQPDEIIPQDYRLEIYGPGDPRVTIIYSHRDNRTFSLYENQSYITLGSADYVIVDTREYTATIYRNGATENAFPLFLSSNIATLLYDKLHFEPRMQINKSSNTHVVLTIYREVSEPWIALT